MDCHVQHCAHSWLQTSVSWASEGEAVLKIQVDGELIRPILAEIFDQNGYVLTEEEFAQRKKIYILIDKLGTPWGRWLVQRLPGHRNLSQQLAFCEFGQ